MSTTEPLTEPELRAKYLAERDKRLRDDGNEQYLQPTGQFAYLLEDPYAEEVERDPVFDEVTVCFVGAGFAGLSAGARLKQAGITDVRLVEKAGDVGGTWYWNRYPGAMCDTAAMIYMPLLEEVGTVPSAKYVRAPEILAHCKRVAEHFELYDNSLFSTEVTDVEWDADASKWIVRTNRGDEFRAKYLAMGTGPLHRPKLPGIPGIDTYEGHSFHTSRWDYDYCGGDPAGAPMTGLADKRVAIIGTGATSVQAIPHLAETAGALYVFQRTPSSIDIRNNEPIDPEWFGELEPGWQEEWKRNFTILQTGGFTDVDLVKDGWTDISQRIRDKAIENGDFSPEGLEQAYYDSDDEKMAEIRARVDEIVGDPDTAAALKPWYRQLCKRPCFHDEYLQAFNNPNVHLVDTDGKGVERIDATGVWVDGVHHEVDCIIYASGFEVGTDYARRSGFDVTGRDGLLLSDKWADGMLSLHGVHVHGFPNMFVVSPTQGANLISNVPSNLVDHADTITAIVSHAESVGASTVEVTEEAETEWVAKLEAGGRRFANRPDCTPGYYNFEGKDAGRRGLLNALGYPDGPVAFFDYIADWRTNGEFAGLDIS